jgi:uncharacterized glyoxalase superfamily protein PhnB
MATATMGSAIIPALRYRNAPEAIEWLCKAFGFQKNAVYPGGNGTIAHAQLTFGTGMIMLGSINPGAFGKVIKQPDEIGGAETQSPCVIVADVDAHYARAKAAGAKMIVDIADMEYGGRAYTCADLEGHLWYFGSYNPWGENAGETSSAAHAKPRHVRNGFAAVRPYVYGYPDLFDFVKKVFGAEELERTNFSHGGSHIELKVGDGVIVLELGDKLPPSAKPSSIYVYVEDVDAAYQRALQAGATSLSEPSDKPYDERSAGLKDRSGNTWWISTYR